MCGFVGFTGEIENSGEIIEKMMSKIVHRGPDSSGIHSGDGVTLGFRRLSIIGLEDGAQPIYNEDETLVIVFNGEIYNYKDIKDELLKAGHVFKTNTDTEVLIHLYEEQGERMLERIRGMFSFVIYDRKNSSLFGVRDFFGIKPFYYAKVGNNLLFGSEIKSFMPFPGFKPQLNELALENYLTFQYSVLPETFFEGVYKLMPAHYMTYKDGILEIKRYWSPKFSPVEIGLENTVTAIDNAVLDSIEMHKVSDVEVGSFLSSGVDSSYVAACFNGGKTFTVGFDYDKYNEIEYAKELSEKVGIKNYDKTISTDEYWDSLKKVQYHMDEPLADPSAVALYFVSGLASRHVKVALSGEGADELFGGYNIYREPLDLKILTSLPLPLRRFLGKIARAVPFDIKGKSFFIRGSMTIEERFIGNANMFSVEERRRILKNSRNTAPQSITKPYYELVRDCDDITKMQYLDIHLWMAGDILLKADKMSMAHSLEVRVPYLDKEVFRVASKIPVGFRVNKTATKYAFRQAARKHIPDKSAGKKKLGFPVPIRIWLREEKYYSIVKGYFTGKAASNYFNIDALIKLLDAHKDGKKDNSRKIWTIFMFLLWHETYLESTTLI